MSLNVFRANVVHVLYQSTHAQYNVLRNATFTLHQARTFLILQRYVMSVQFSNYIGGNIRLGRHIADGNNGEVCKPSFSFLLCSLHADLSLLV